MSAEALIPPPPGKRRRRWAWIGGATAVVALGGIGIGLGPAAPWLIDNVSDGRSVGRIGKLRIDGVSGAWLGDLRVRDIAIEDEDGVWAEAHDVTLRWNPLDLLFNATTNIDLASAQRISILRQPILSEARPPRASSFHIDLDALTIEHLSLAEPVAGAAAEFRASAAVDVSEDDFAELDLELRRLDSDADRAIVHFRAHDRFMLQVDVESDEGGVLSRLLGFPDRALRIEGEGSGQGEQGSARLDARIGDEEIASGALRWAQARWSVEAHARLDLLPITGALTRRLGNKLEISGAGAGPGAFQLHAEMPNLRADVNGTFDEDWALTEPARIVAVTPRLSAIARETPFEFGQARFEGTLSLDDGVAVNGELDAADLDVLGRRTRMTGPAQARLDGQRFTLTADLRAPTETPALFANARLQTQLNYDRQRRRFTLERTTITGDAIAIDASGWSNGQDGEFAGNWRLLKNETLFPGVLGAAGGRWRAFTASAGANRRVWAASMEGQGANIGGDPEIVPQLLGRAPRLDGRFRFEQGGVTVEHARIDGAQLRMAASGRIVRGEADLALEASARGPLNIGDAEIAGAVDATGRLSGRIVRPTLNATAQLASFTAAGVAIDQPNVTFTLAPAGAVYRGQAEMHGRYAALPASATAFVSVDKHATLTMTDLVAHVGSLEARGTAQVGQHGAHARLALGGGLDGLAEGLTGRVTGNAELTPTAITLAAQIADARAGELRIRAAAITAAGPYRAIESHFDMRGALRRAPLTFAGQALIGATDRGTLAQIAGEGALAGHAIATRTPIVIRWHDNATEATLDMRVADGGLTAHWSERGHVLQGVATIGETPIAPLAAIWGERATGRIAGRAEIRNVSGGLAGDARLTLTDARFAGRQRGALSGTFNAHLEPGRLTAQIDAQSSDGLVAHLEADAPVTTSASPVLIALAPQRRGTASWSVRGRAGSLFAVARLPDQDLEGDLTGEGRLSFGAGNLAGDGHIDIANGRFEDKLSGVKLENLDASIGFGDDGVSIRRFTATDSRGGRLSATGGSANPREGRIAVELIDLRLVDRPDAKARASGQLAFAWQGMDATLSGTLNIDEADINVAQNPEAGIPNIDVVEINLPSEELEEEGPARQPLGRTTLDVRINAPARVFTRGRGIDAEWSLDMRLAGTTAAPLVFGEAQALRGTLSLSGQPFEIDSARIDFNGAVEEARLALTATRDTADLTAQIHLSGTASDPDISFTSTPPLPEDEILPQVLFGHGVEDLNGLEAAQLAASLAALSGRASFDLVDAARAAAGLDRFNLRQDDDGGFLVAGGVYLTRGVYVELQRTGLGQAATRVEWTIRPRLVLITSFLANGDQRASVRWRRESD